MKETIIDVASFGDCSQCNCHINLNGCHICKFYSKVIRWTHKEHPAKPGWCKVDHFSIFEVE